MEPDRSGKGRFVIALAIFFVIAVTIPLLANVLPDHTRTLANAPEILSRTYITRVVNYAVSGKKADMVVAGSSLVVFPHVLTDGYYEKVPVPVPDPIEYADFLRNYVEMAFLKRLLAESGDTKNGDKKVVDSSSVVDLGVPSLMLSDCELLFEKLQSNNAMPKTAVLLLAPRDFMDNTVAVDRNLFLHEINGRITASELFSSKNYGNFFGKLFAAADYGVNETARQFRTGWQRVILGVKRWGRKRKKEMVTPDRELALRYFYFGNGKLPDLDVYKTRYNPPNRERINEQLAAMSRLLDMLKANSVNTTVVLMPLTRENFALIDDQAKFQIFTGMARECEKRAVRYIVAPNLDSYERGDFLDSVHLNAPGGNKFFRRLAKVLSEPQQ